MIRPANELLAPAPPLQLCSNKRSLHLKTWREERSAQQRQPAAASLGSGRPSYAHTGTPERGSLFHQQTAMPLNNGNTVAVERRMDLASLFCMIGRHGPAVALAVIAMVSVLAGFIIYRTVRGKRRKATAAAGDGDGRSAGAERDAAMVQSSPEESRSSVESTDMSDEGLSDVKEDVELIQSDLKIRHRRAAAAEKKSPPYSPPKSDNQEPDIKHTTSAHTEEMHREVYAEEASQGLQSDTYTVAEMVDEDAVDCHQGATDGIVEDVIEEGRDNDSCLEESELINDENHEEEEKVLKGECQEDKDVTTDKDVSNKKTKQEEENFECTLNNPVCFEQTPHMGEKGDDDRLQDKKTTLKTNWVESSSEEPVIYTEDVPVSCICYCKDEKFEEENAHSIDCYNYSCKKQVSPEEEKKNEGEEAVEECEEYKVIAQQDEMWSSTFEKETNLPSTEQDQCDHVTDKVTPLCQDSDWDEDGCLAAEVIEELRDEDYLNEAVRSGDQLLQFNKQEAVIEQKEEIGEDSVLYDGADQVNEKMLTSDDIVVCGEEHDSSSVRLSVPIKVDNQDDKIKEDKIALCLHEDTDSTTLGPQMPSHKTEDLPESSGNSTTVVLAEECNDQLYDPQDSVLYDSADQVNEKMLTSDNIVVCGEEHDSVSLPCLSIPIKVENQDDKIKEDRAILSLDEDTDSTTLGPQMPSHETTDLPENSGNGTTVVLAEECNDQLYDPHIQSCFNDQQSVQMINNDVFDKASVAADPDTAESITASVITEEISCPNLPSICQDQQSDHMENNETFDEIWVNSATDAPACDNANIVPPGMSEELYHPDMSSSQDQQSDQTKNKGDFSEVTTGTAPVMSKDISHPMCQIHLLSFEQSELRDNDISSPGVGEESGISSMAVSPDLQDPGKEFDMTVENMALRVMDCDLLPKGQTEAQNSIFADDVAISVIEEDTAGRVFGPYPSQPPHSKYTDWTTYELFAANEDMFGHEIEDSYHREMDQFTAQIAASITSLTDELKIQTDMKAIVEVVEIKEKKAGVIVEKKEETKAEKEEEEDNEKTEISIMEATMDNNEWITESNYQVLPWMKLSAPSFSQDHTKTSQLPTEDSQCSSAVTDTTCTDTSDTPPSTEVKENNTLSLVDESMENNKKVVAVQPMPQNVNVTFHVHYFTQSPYQTVAVTGNLQELGNWKGFVPLERSKDGHWATVVSLPAESHVEWKFVVVDKGEVCRWEECGNRLLDTGFGDDLLVQKWWGLF
ncbi:uncharacterized protein stbd1 [Morone saxatilis]|uniref:uncharacterized protein stbd1 n=1 Tax=Morone saxatilis TaxID=34816 RepID=UPI0015E22B53|nr:uncharacterized protein stbd1 [Morone saxatilis]